MTLDEIFTRTSVRTFEDRPVPEEDVELMLKAAMHAPSAMNQQCWEFFVVDDRALLLELSRSAPYAGPVGRAPMAIVLAAADERMKAPLMWQQDLAAAAQNILLAAKSRGVGTVWIGIAPHPDRMAAVAGVLGLPGSLKPFCIIAMGYPPGDVAPNEGRYKPERIHRNRFVAKGEGSSRLRGASPI
jgi:nitroreductase